MMKRKAPIATLFRLLPSLAVVLTVLAFQSVRAESIVNETFDSEVAPAKWTIFPKGTVSAAEGVLTITASGSDTGYAVSSLAGTKPIEALNFTKNTVEIKLTNIALKGDASPERQVFHVMLLSDSKGDDATAKVHVRLSGDGDLILTIKDKNSPAPQVLYNTRVVLPVKSLTLKLTKTHAMLLVEDDKAAPAKELPITGSLAAWETAAPYFRLQAQRNPGGGSLQVTLQGVSIDSTPAAESK